MSHRAVIVLVPTAATDVTATGVAAANGTAVIKACTGPVGVFNGCMAGIAFGTGDRMAYFVRFGHR